MHQDICFESARYFLLWLTVCLLKCLTLTWSSITAVRGRSLRRGKRRNLSSPPCRRLAPWLCRLLLRLRRQSNTVTSPRCTLPLSSLKPTAPSATHLRLRHHAGAIARMPSALPVPAAHYPSTCSTQRGCAMAVAGSATGLCSSRTWSCPWTWPASTRS